MYYGFRITKTQHQGGSSAMSIGHFLLRGQRRRMQKVLRKLKSRNEALRARVLLLLHEGCTASEVVVRVGCVWATVYRTMYRCEELGEAALYDQRGCR